ncbi:TPA: response regulator transcription factor [Legionella pneumophila]
MNKNAMLYIVDDDDSMLYSLEWFFTSMNIAVKVYNNANDFLKYHNPDDQGCLISDVRMPGMDGFELLNKLKAQKSQLKIIFMTAFGEIPLAIRAIKAGAVDFITKPFNKKGLLELVQKCLQHHSNNPIDKENLLSEQELKALESLWKEK